MEILIGAAIFVAVAIIAVVGTFVFGKKERRTYKTRHGMSVITNDIQEVTEALMFRATELYLQLFPKLVPAFTEDELRKTVDHLEVEWVREPFLSRATGETGQILCMGTRWYYQIKVVWCPNICDSGYFHELTHWFLAQKYGNGDGFHRRQLIWGIIGNLKEIAKADEELKRIAALDTMQREQEESSA